MALIKLSRKQYVFLFYFVISLRIVVPLFMWVNPFVVAIIAELLDAPDYVLIMNAKLGNHEKYQKIDKALDFYYLSILFIFSIIWGNVLLIGLFIFRLIGFLIFAVTQKRVIFVLFPNVFEWVFNVYSYAYTYDISLVETFDNNLLYILIPIIILKMGVELYIHYFQFDSMAFILGIVKKE